jgi:hypothetical protein
VAGQPPAGESGQLTASQPGARDQQPGGEGAVRRIDRDSRLIESQPAPGQRKPCLVDRLLGAEQQPIPAWLRRRGREGAQSGALVGGRDDVQHALGQPVIGLGIKPEGEHVLDARDGRCPVAGAMGHAADDARRPLRRAAQAGHDRDGRPAEGGKRGAGARPRGGELPAPLVHRAAQGGLLLGEQHDVEHIAERFDGRHLGRQDFL